MSAVPLSVCRVCLASDREMYRLANTALEETYERVTSGTLVVEGRPCCVCGVCLSALRRCRRFIETAREANDALDRWIRNQPDTDTLKLVQQPLFSFTHSPVEVFDVTSHKGAWGAEVKQESDNADTMINQQNENNSEDKDNIPMEEIKDEDTSDDGSDNTHVANDGSDETHVLDNSESISSEVVSNFINGNREVTRDKLVSPGASDGGTSHPTTSQEDVPLRRLRSGRKIKLNDNRSGPAVKKSRPIPSEHRRGNTDPPAALHKEGKTFSCRHCNYEASKEYHLKLHLKTHKAGKLFVCYMCNDYNTFGHRQYLNHLLTHAGEKRCYSCNKCDFTSIYKNNLERHLLTHNTENPFACDSCDYRTNNKIYLIDHIKTHNSVKPFSCDKCDYKSHFYYHLKRHLMIHTGEKRFMCDKCDYRCTFSADLRRHLNSHSGAKPFACDKCDYKCAFKSSLKKHLIIHSDEKPFACDKCDFKFSRKSYLRRHSITHTGEKRFACDKCNFKCLVKSSLKRHNMIHTGEKPFACDKCDYKCSLRTNLKNHLRTHNGKHPLVCDKCDYKCTNINALSKHKAKVHMP